MSETRRLLLRRWSENDLNGLVRLLADSRVVRHITDEYGPLSRQETEQAHARVLLPRQERGFGPWAAIDKTGGTWIGKVGLNVLDDWPGRDKIEVECQLDPLFWGRGLATECGRAEVQYGFEALGLDRIISVTVPENVASRRVMEKCGLTYQGTIAMMGRLTKRTRDVVWYAIDRSAWIEGRMIGGETDK